MSTPAPVRAAFRTLPWTAWGLFLLQLGIFRRFEVDDAYIVYRHARNLAHGLGPVMNAGERVEGVSNLPWTIVLGLGTWLGAAPPVLGPLLAMVAGCALVTETRALARTCGASRRAATAAALMVAGAAPVAIWARSGLETTAYAWAVVAALRLALAAKHPARTGVAVGCAAALRPEGILVMLPALLTRLPRGRRDTLRLLLGTASILLPLEAFRLAYYGAWLPNPVLAKAGLGLAWQPGLIYLAKLVGVFLLPWLLALSIAHRTASLRTLGAWIVLQALFIVAVGGERFPGYRFAVAAWPAVSVAAAMAWWDAPPVGLRRRAVRAASALAAAAAVLLAVWPQRLTGVIGWVFELVRSYHTAAAHEVRLLAEVRALALAAAVAALALALRARLAGPATPATPAASFPGRRAWMLWGAWLTATLLPLAVDPDVRRALQPDPAARLGRVVGTWLRAHTPPDALVATNAAGALAYWSERPIVDMLGLTDRHIARRPPDRSQWMGHEKGDGAYVLARRPDLILFGGPEGSVEPWPFVSDREIAASPDFRRSYVAERVDVEGIGVVLYRRLDGRVPPLGQRVDAVSLRRCWTGVGRAPKMRTFAATRGFAAHPTRRQRWR